LSNLTGKRLLISNHIIFLPQKLVLPYHLVPAPFECGASRLPSTHNIGGVADRRASIPRQSSPTPLTTHQCQEFRLFGSLNWCGKLFGSLKCDYMHRVQQYHWGFPFCPTCSYGFYTRNGGAQTRLFGAKTADKDSQGGAQVSREPCEVVDLGAEAASPTWLGCQ
jgi:hypothetical protein